MIAGLVLVLISSLPGLLQASPPPRYVRPNCTNFTCGNFNISYPFGMGEACYANSWYSINCNHSFHPPKPFLNHTRLNLEVLNISLEYPTVTVNSPISSLCNSIDGNMNETKPSIDLNHSPFFFSRIDNIFMVLGCGNARLMYHSEVIIAGCGTICEGGSAAANNCYGIDCCQTTIPTTNSFALSHYIVNLKTEKKETGCVTRALVVDRDWFSRNFSSKAVRGMEYAPLVLLWRIEKHDPDASNRCSNPLYYDSDSRTYYRYRCTCGWKAEGNPYLLHGCQVARECANCRWGCDDRYNDNTHKYDFYCSTKNKSKALILENNWILESKKRFFKRNGGLLLQQQISSDKVAFEKTKIFTSDELEKATDNFNKNRILGQGGQGTVYKGMLNDGRIVAVKKSKIVDENQLVHFINEIVILSQINHRNVVGILGCCLETEVPLLVYEFISNGTLFQLIHDQNSEFPLSWEMRLRIASEVSGALSYLHSACSIPIYHRDIKSTNILLDDKYKAKVSDFGTSRSISIDQTHLTTLVQGTFGYLDPEYFQSSQFTEKSDVYSFGVVLVELLTGQKPISSTRSPEEKSLATHFILSLQESRLVDILDAQVVKEGQKEDIMAFAKLAGRCLNLNGRKRPTMKEVTT
ncbi:hypothetical protein PVL29_022228 [Vitis rotundifolia]|uniref:Protein kinase domain-containing protein n=1 Tax=Vitis rotundifolia TaxID=103349 RepID=A0AA38YUV1_VITRO|nr:hypothetical protein PVL29_022228 [Vitis rotundifolia]